MCLHGGRGDHPSVGQWTQVSQTVLTRVIGFSWTLSMNFSFLWPHCQSWLHFSIPWPHPKLLPGKFTAGTHMGSVQGESLPSLWAAAGPLLWLSGTQGLVTLLYALMSLFLGLLCCRQTWATCSQGQPWGTSVKQDCIQTPEFRLHNLPPSSVSLGSMGHPACPLSSDQNPCLRCHTIKASVTVCKIGRVGSETWESESECCSVLSHSLWLHGLWPAREFCPWNPPGKNTGAVAISFSRDLPDPGLEPVSPAPQVDSLSSEPPGRGDTKSPAQKGL